MTCHPTGNSGLKYISSNIQQAGAFSEGYSAEFAELMRECCQSLMAKFSAICRFAKSDRPAVLDGIGGQGWVLKDVKIMKTFNESRHG